MTKARELSELADALTVTGGNVDFTGTVTADALTVDGTATVTGTNLTIKNDASFLKFENASAVRTGYIQSRSDAFDIWNDQATPMVFGTSNTERLRITSTGNVGIGTSSPSEPLHIFKATYPIFKIESTSYNGTLGIDTANGNLVLNNISNAALIFDTNNTERMRIDSSGNVGVTEGAKVYFGGTTDPSSHYIKYNSGNNGLELHSYGSTIFTNTSGTERMRIDSSGRVGIGTSSPAYSLDIQSISGVRIAGGASDTYIIPEFYGSGVSSILTGSGAKSLALGVNGAERLRIDSSGNLLVGKTTQDFGASNGFEFYSGGGADTLLILARGSNPPLEVRRNTSDGSIVTFKKDGTTVGSIGVDNTHLYLSASGTTGAGLRLQSNNIVIPTTNASISDANVDLGYSANRFKDLYLSGGVYLGGTGAANYLDDYEEGTWTPTVTSGTISAINSATYTKIGRLVFVQTDMGLSGTRGSENFQIRGLPFTVGNSRYSAMPMYHQYSISSHQQVQGVALSGTTYIGFNGMGIDIAGTAFSNGYINVSGCYVTND